MTKEEYMANQQHVRIAIKYCVKNGFSDEAYIIGRHHELFEPEKGGKTMRYPRRGAESIDTKGNREVSEENIERLAQFLALADSLDALVSERPYKKLCSRKVIEDVLRRFIGDSHLIEQIFKRFPQELQ